MGVNTFSDLGRLAFSPLKTPEDQQDVVENVFKLSVRGILLTGGIAIISAIFNRYVNLEGTWRTLAPNILKASLGGCGAYALVAAYLSYKLLPNIEDVGLDWDKTDKRTTRFEQRLFNISLGGVLAAFLVSYFYKGNQAVNSIANHSILPLLGINSTSFVILFFHSLYSKKAKEFS